MVKNWTVINRRRSRARENTDPERRREFVDDRILGKEAAVNNTFITVEPRRRANGAIKGLNNFHNCE